MSIHRMPLKPAATPIVPAAMNLVEEMTQTQEQPAFQHIQQILSIAEQKVVADGPLARAVTEELNRKYKREIDPVTGVCLETQAIEAVMGAKLWASTQEQALQDGDTTQYGQLFAVQRDHTRFVDVQQLRNDLRMMNDEQRAASAVILNTPEGVQIAQESGNRYDRHLRDVAVEFGVPLFPSLEAYLQARLRNR